MKSSLWIGVIIGLITVALICVTWNVISMLESNSVAMRKFKTADKYMNAEQQTMMNTDNPAVHEVEDTAFENISKNAEYDFACQLKSSGKYEEALKHAFGALDQAKEKLEKNGHSKNKYKLALRNHLIGGLYMRLQKPKQALPYLSESIKLAPSKPSYLLRSKCYEQLGDSDNAKADVNSAHQCKTQYPQQWGTFE